MPPKGQQAERLWRRFFSEFGLLIQQNYDWQEMADLFHEWDMIDRPTIEYDGTKRDFVIDLLSGTRWTKEFLKIGVPRVVFAVDMEGTSTEQIAYAMERLGYRLDEDGQKHGVASYEPPTRLPRLPYHRSSPAATPEPTPKDVVSIPELPSELLEYVKELNDNLARGNKNAAALLTRKIISQGIFVAMSKRGKEAELKTTEGDDLDLGLALKRCKQACGVSAQVMGRVTSAKWIGDTANHSYVVKVTEDELERCVTGMTLFLREVLADPR